MKGNQQLHANESIKTRSNFLRGTILEGLSDLSTGSISEDDTQLTKFHGIYQQDDRDVRAERRKKKLEKAYSFMIRVRVPGGVCTPEQWLAMDRISSVYANGTIKLTTRQAFQFHGVIKTVLKRSMQDINEALLDTLAACGDVNRNVMCNPNPYQSKHHAEVLEFARRLSDELSPRTSAYHEIWLDEKKVYDGETEVEPIYGPTYLPRKFKTVVAVPPSNDVDIYAHDLGYIAIIENDQIVGYNVTVGGGLGMTHGVETTFPRAANLLGFCTPDQAMAVAVAVMTTQRDFGNREDRKQARMKYTIERMGLAGFKEEVERRLGYAMEAPRPFEFTETGDRYGWIKGTDEKWHLTLFIQNGRVKDEAGFRLKTALREIASKHEGDFRLTANQNLIIGSVAEGNKEEIDRILSGYGVKAPHEYSKLRLNSMACVALPTCGLALAESERYLPDLVTEIEKVMERCGLADDEVVIRMTGCPNGCARPYLAEIGLVGRGPNTYNLYLGAAFDGSRLNKLYRRDVRGEAVPGILEPLFRSYAKEREDGERFGNFLVRTRVVAATQSGADFHDHLPAEVDG
ncbi:MAG: NADPH-dependent assimilatory sulfite reductase hemoprotein subunit [Puniceicoccaceae bacterium]